MREGATVARLTQDLFDANANAEAGKFREQALRESVDGCAQRVAELQVQRNQARRLAELAEANQVAWMERHRQVEAEVARLTQELKDAKGQLREWMACNAPGGWIDDIRLERNRAEAEVARLTAAPPSPDQWVANLSAKLERHILGGEHGADDAALWALNNPDAVTVETILREAYCEAGAAPPPPQDAAFDAHGFVRNLLSRLPFPDCLPAPEIIVEDDGELSFDWDIGARATVTVSLSAVGVVRWAALIDDWKASGHFSLPSWSPEFNEAMTRLGRNISVAPTPQAQEIARLRDELAHERHEKETVAEAAQAYAKWMRAQRAATRQALQGVVERMRDARTYAATDWADAIEAALEGRK